MAESKMVPELRFAGFNEPWKQHKLTDIFDFLKNNTLSRAELDDESGIAKNIHYGDILIKFGEYLDVSQVKLPFIVSQQIVEKFKGSLLQDGDVIIADTAEDEAVGKCSEIAGLQGFPTISGLHTIPIRPKEKFAAGYLGYYMNSATYHDQLLPLMQGIKVTSVSKAAIQNTDLHFPSDTAEQAAIGQYFIRLDNLITLHQKKYNKLLALKKSLLEKMFPKAGSDVPKIRFAGFTVPWEQHKVGEILVERNEQAPKSTEYPLMAFIADAGVAPKGERYDRSALVNDAESKLYKKTEKGDFIYSSNNLETGSIGLNKYGKATISPVYSIFTPTELTDSDFIGRRLIRKDFINEMVKWRQGVIYGQWKIHESDFVKIDILIPAIEEQQKIGTFLDGLDNLIALYRQKHEKLGQLKQSLLEKMFV